MSHQKSPPSTDPTTIGPNEFTLRLSRRRALSLAAQGAGLAMVAPSLLLSRKAYATAATGKVKHVLVLNCRGGFRSHCTFNAVGALQHNPFGTQAAQAGTEWTLGAACGRLGYSTTLGTVPAFADITKDVAILGAVDPNKGGPIEVDHTSGQRRAGTGLPDGKTGILSLVGAHHPLYADGFSADRLPPVEIGPSDFGLGEGIYGERRPLSLFGAQFAGVGGADDEEGLREVVSPLRERFDKRFLARRSTAWQKRLKAFRLAKQNAALFQGMLADPILDVIGAPDASGAGVTNAQLLEVLGNHNLSEIGDPQPSLSWGADIALALRCFAFGAPMVSVLRDVFDMHDIERDAYAPRTQDLVRQLAGLSFLLKRMPHPEGGTYFDHTLVVTMSEFSRNNTFETTGFNSGNGSDHVGQGADPARNMAIAMMGGVVTRGGDLIGGTDDDMKATGAVFSTADVLATVLDAVGVDPTPHMPGTAIDEVFA